MIKRVLLVGIIFIFFGCKKEEANEFSFDSFVFSLSGRREANSIKFTKSDTVYLQRRFPEPTENFYAIIQNDEKIKLNKYLQSLNFKKFKSLYAQENVCDAGTCLINFSNNGKSNSILIYGGIAPKELYTFIDSLVTFKKNLNFLPTKKLLTLEI